jgi:hypothetical protein
MSSIPGMRRSVITAWCVEFGYRLQTVERFQRALRQRGLKSGQHLNIVVNYE